MWRRLLPQAQVPPEEAARGRRALMYDGVCSQVMGALTGGAFLVALALTLGASHLVIGLVAALPPLAQILQLPAVVLVDRVRMRKLLTVVYAFLSRLSLAAIVVLPWLVAPSYRVAVLLLALVLHFSLASVSGCAFNPWMRDFLPEATRASFFGRRFAVATAASAAASLVAGLALDAHIERGAPALLGYAIVFLVGTLTGLLGVGFLSRVPEPATPDIPHRPLRDILLVPLGDARFRALLVFLASWNFAANMATPFFAVYMFDTLGLPVGLVVVLAVLSQVANVVGFRAWGVLADRYGNRRVLELAGPLFIVSLLIWPFTAMPEPHALTLPLLGAIHIIAGIAIAGVTLCTGTIALKNAPAGHATAYLATNALVSGAAAIVAPLLAGAVADVLATQQFTLSLQWKSTLAEPTSLSIPALDLQGLDFVFLGAVVVGLYALHRLVLVQEEGVLEERISVADLYAEVRKTVRDVSTAAGIHQLIAFPYGILRSFIERRRTPRVARRVTGP